MFKSTFQVLKDMATPRRSYTLTMEFVSGVGKKFVQEITVEARGKEDARKQASELVKRQAMAAFMAGHVVKCHGLKSNGHVTKATGKQ